MRRRPPVTSHVFIHADAMIGRSATSEHDALPSLQSWQDVIESEEVLEKAVATPEVEPLAEEEISLAPVSPKDVIEGFVYLGDSGVSDAPSRKRSQALTPFAARK